MNYCAEHAIPHSVFIEQWSVEDRGKALAFVREKNLKCGMCGTARWEWEENRFAYYPKEEICPGCEKKDFVMDTRHERHPGLYVTLVPDGA